MIIVLLHFYTNTKMRLLKSYTYDGIALKIYTTVQFSGDDLFGCIFSKTAERIQLKLCMELRSVLDAASRSLVVVTYEVPSPEPKFFFSLTVFLFGSHYFVFIH